MQCGGHAGVHGQASSSHGAPSSSVPADGTMRPLVRDNKPQDKSSANTRSLVSSGNGPQLRDVVNGNEDTRPSPFKEEARLRAAMWLASTPDTLAQSRSGMPQQEDMGMAHGLCSRSLGMSGFGYPDQLPTVEQGDSGQLERSQTINPQLGTIEFTYSSDSVLVRWPSDGSSVAQVETDAPKK